jgi:hypothetical protein
VIFIATAWGTLASIRLRDQNDNNQGNQGNQVNDDESKIKRGFEIAPVPLNLDGKNRALVGLGSYIVNAQGDCQTTASPELSPFFTSLADRTSCA